MINWKQIIFLGLWRRKDREEYRTVKENSRKSIELSKRAREDAEKRIKDMMAQMDGCGDDWFRGPLEPLDECGPNGVNGE